MSKKPINDDHFIQFNTLQSSTMQNECPLKKVENNELIARKFGFYWEHIDQLIEQIQNECAEVQEAWERRDTDHLQEEIGDLLQAAASLAVFCGFDPRQTLDKSVDKFKKRYDTLVELAQQDGHEHLHHQPFDILMGYWKRAKKITKDV